jgi:Macrocin-O-methyltransferase (TylF)
VKRKTLILIVVVACGVLLGGVITRILHFGLGLTQLETQMCFVAMIDVARQRWAAYESALYVDEHMGAARSLPDKFKLLEASLKEVDPSLGGLYCEFGVYKGTTINFIASVVKEEVHGFDSFEGLPEDWWGGFEKGTFKVQELPAVRDNVRLHKGWFSDSLPSFRKQYKEPMGFMHMDADLYSSTKDVFELLADRIIAGTVIQFDEFFNYPGWQNGEYRAFREFCEFRHVEFKYIGYCGADEQVAVKILKIEPPSR